MTAYGYTLIRAGRFWTARVMCNGRVAREAFLCVSRAEAKSEAEFAISQLERADMGDAIDLNHQEHQQ